MMQLIMVFQVLMAIGLIILVLIQQGKGAQMGAAFGSGASQTLFGSQGSSSFLLKLTALFAALFFAACLLLGFLASKQVRQDPLQGLTSSVIQAPQKAKNAPIIPDAGVPLPTNGTLPATTPPAQQ